MLLILNSAVGLLILSDFGGAAVDFAPDRRTMLLQLYTIADLVVLVSLLVAPFLTQDITFLRILRGLRLLHSYHLVRDLRRDSEFFRRHEDSVMAGMNLFVFIFVTTSLAFALFFEAHTGGRRLYRRALFHRRHADHDGLRRHHPAFDGGQDVLGRGHGDRRRALRAVRARAVSTQQGQIPLPGMRAEPARS